jgi:hypothetical protein
MEPISECVIVSPAWAKRLAHGTDEHAPMARRRDRSSGSWRLGRRERKEQGSKRDCHAGLKRWRLLLARE